MYTEYHVKCLKCNNKFSYLNGSTFKNIIIRCLKCGKEKEVDLSESINIEKKEKCECGGLFSSHGKPRCPKCGSNKISKPFEIIQK